MELVWWCLSYAQFMQMDYLICEAYLRQLKEHVDMAVRMHVARARPAFAVSRHFLKESGLNQPDRQAGHRSQAAPAVVAVVTRGREIKLRTPAA